MEGTFAPVEGWEGKIQRTILLGMRTFHPKEALAHMEEGWMLVEEGLFHPEEPSFLIWMAMMLPKEGTFLLGEGPVRVFQPPFLLSEAAFLLKRRANASVSRTLSSRRGADASIYWRMDSP